MYILNIARAIKRFHKRHFMFEIYYKRIGFSKENSYYSIKRLEKKRFIVSSKQINGENSQY